MIIPKNFLRKTMLDGRIGHSTYLLFFLVFLNFILISFSYLIEDNLILESIFSDLWIFTIIFLIFYIPISTIIGRWHTNTQISIEQDILRSEDPILAKMVRSILDVNTGNATKEEINEFRKQMIEIEKQSIDE